jgi:hypothetical protein
LVSPDNDQTYQVYNQLNPGENKFELTNPEGFGQKYKGVTLQIDKRYSNNWLLSSSLTLSKSEGLTAVSRYNYNDQMTLTSWTYNEGKDPNDWTNGQGLMPMDRKWVFKLQLAYNFPWDILASVNYLYMSGRPIGALVRVFPDQGQRTFLAEPRSNANRTDPYGLLDIRLSKTFNLHESFRFSVMVDVFNVFNNDTAIDFYTYDLWNSYYLEPWYLPAPVRAQIGLKLEF